MPMNTANKLTLARVFMIPLFLVIAYWGFPGSRYVALGVYILACLTDLLDEIPVDACRYFFNAKPETQMEFDLGLAVREDSENPVYYVQYAHARISAVLRRAAERGVRLPGAVTAADLTPLDTPEDLALLRKAAGFEDMLTAAARNLGVHHVSHYLTELAGLLHSYYARHQVLLPDDAPRSMARLALLRAVAQVLRNGLDVLGVSAPESM